MLKNLILVNAEEFWDEYFPEYQLYHVRLQTSKWLLHEGQLWVFDGGKRMRVDGILWLIGAVQPNPYHRDILELIRFAGVPCVNPATVLLRDLHRLTMLNDLREAGLPVVPFTGVVGTTLMHQLPPQVPSVIKIGNHHAGNGKMRLNALEQWQDMAELVFAADQYYTIEPFIEYRRDIRMLAVDRQIWALERQGSRWKANSGIVETRLIAAPDILYDYTRRLMQHIQADIMALDILETADQEYFVLEYNAVPGLNGFPFAVIEAIVERVKARVN